jgi:hypothetical protein
MSRLNNEGHEPGERAISFSKEPWAVVCLVLFVFYSFFIILLFDFIVVLLIFK